MALADLENEQEIEMCSSRVSDLVIVENREFDIGGRFAEPSRLRRLVLFPVRGYASPRRESLQREFSGPHW